jgi:hypothetical protein
VDDERTSLAALTPYGDELFLTGIGNDVDTLTLSATGTYTLLVEGRRYQSAANAYRFLVQPVADDAAALVLGERVAGAIAHAGQVDRYTFTLDAPKHVAIETQTDTDFRLRLPGRAASSSRTAACGSRDRRLSGVRAAAGLRSRSRRRRDRPTRSGCSISARRKRSRPARR